MSASFFTVDVTGLEEKAQIYKYLYHGGEAPPINGQDLAQNFEKYLIITKIEDRSV